MCPNHVVRLTPFQRQRPIVRVSSLAIPLPCHRNRHGLCAATAFAMKSEAQIPGMFRGMFDNYVRSPAGRAMLLEFVREIEAADEAVQAKVTT